MAYPESDSIKCPFKGLRLTVLEACFNQDMSRARIPNEWGFGKLKSLFAYLDFEHGLKPYLNDISVYWPVATILTNCHTCLYGSQTSEYFGVLPPSMEEYLENGEDMPRDEQ